MMTKTFIVVTVVTFLLATLYTTTAEDRQNAVASYQVFGEELPQSRLFMVFGVAKEWNKVVPGVNMVDAVERALVGIAQAASKFQPVTIFVLPSQLNKLKSLMGNWNQQNITYVKEYVDDIWARDTLPMFVQESSSTRNGPAAVGLNFNGWGNKQEHSSDKLLAQKVAKYLNIPFVKSSLVGESGGIETDGEGTAIMTESCWLNPNRNPGKTKEQLEADFKKYLGIQKIIWLPGAMGKDITDAHVDFYARFVKPGVVLANMENDPSVYDYQVTRTHLDILNKATDFKGRPLKVTTMATPTTLRTPFSRSTAFAPGYINFVVLNGAVLMPQFGDSGADQAAFNTIQQSFPDRKVIQLNIDPISAGGGGIHCVTMNQPLIQ